MIDVSLTRNKLDNLASQIEQRDPVTAVRLRDLGEGVVGGPTAEAWAFSNIRSVLDPERIANKLVGDSSSDVLTRGLEVLRNSLVLLPLALTWFGIALAVDGYYKLVGAHPELAGQSFIYLWQGGFRGLMRLPLPLGTLAIVDAVLLGTVFLLTLAAYARSGWLSLANESLGARVGRDLDEALSEAELVLAPRRAIQYQASFEKLEQNAEDLLHEIADERGRVGKLAQRREQELGDLTGITDNMKNSAVVFLNAAQSLANTHTATLAALNGVTGNVKALTGTQQDVIKAVYQVARRVEALLPPGGEPGIQGAPGSPTVASPQYSMVNLMIEQQQTLQDTLHKIESLIAVQQEGMEKLFRESLYALPVHTPQASGAGPTLKPSTDHSAPESLDSKTINPMGNVGPRLPKPPDTPRKS